MCLGSCLEGVYKVSGRCLGGSVAFVQKASVMGLKSVQKLTKSFSKMSGGCLNGV